MCCFGHWLHMYTKLKKYVYCILLKKGVCVCTVYIYMDLSAHQNITKIHALKMIFKIINRYLHIHISCDIYIYTDFTREYQWILAPPPNKLSERGSNPISTSPFDAGTKTHPALVYRSLKCFAEGQYPHFSNLGPVGCIHHIDSDRESRSPKKSETAKKSSNFTQTSDVLCFTQRPGTKKKSVAKRFQVNYREEQSLRMLRSSTHAWFDSSSSN